MRNRLLRVGLVTLMLSVVMSCGGGGGGGVDGSASATGAMGSTTGVGAMPGTDGSPGANGAGNGIGGIGADDGSTATAASGGGGDDGSGVGSGGTGVSTADATGVGSVDGAGSIIVNGLRYDTRTATGSVEDAPNGLQLGMSAKVTGPVNTDFTQGVARWVESAADVRGPAASVNLARGTFVILGTTVTTDEATVWADVSGLASIQAGQTLQVWGLPGVPGVLRATRIEQRPVSSPILTGTVQNLDAGRRTFTLGQAVVDYSRAMPDGMLDGRPLVNGTLVRVRADMSGPGNSLLATRVQWWYPVPTNDNGIAQLAGIVTDFAGLGSLRVLGFPVDASAAKVTAGPNGAVGNGVKVEVGGAVSGGVLRATKLKIRNVPGTGGPASFDLSGNVGAFRSASDFRVRGQPIDASAATFVNGQAAGLRNGVRVRVQGAQVVDGVLAAQTVTFQ
ncbi:DUF5666 domain-containing protein [Variovorax sp. OV329]|uniref:DUF5666 domain-containing protein n=1 Tax=Variovorax sp. OV329 TaxID=1882825 RepID=UPI0008E1153F|nr:DUF5666 domain-containing protein [Variovorax sp. OV329]SFM56272.1 hypothetical protein SAMN05444747_106228 [Variovorax sp. OV329]